MDCYKKFAKYYDELMQDCDYENWSQYLLTLIKKYSNKKSCLDLACGSGKHTIMLKKAGYDVVGLDISEEMLQQAKNNSRQAYTNIVFIKQDISNFNLGKKFDIITCICDGYNYIKPMKLQQAFVSAYNSLNKGGVLLFDLSSEFKLSNVLGNNLMCDDTDDITYLWQNTLNDNSVFMDLTFFVKEDDGKYSRFDEQHLQYMHNTQTVKEKLFNAGFISVQSFGFLTETEPSQTDERVQFVALKMED